MVFRDFLLNASKHFTYSLRFLGILCSLVFIYSCAKETPTEARADSAADAKVLPLEENLSTKAGVRVYNTFIKQMPPRQTVAAAYLSLENKTDKTQILNYVHSPKAEHIEVHRTFYEDGVMQMRPVKRVSIDPAKQLHFKPGGFHLMLMGVQEEFAVGDRFPITLEFESGVVVNTEVEVRPQG